MEAPRAPGATTRCVTSLTSISAHPVLPLHGRTTPHEAVVWEPAPGTVKAGLSPSRGTGLAPTAHATERRLMGARRTGAEARPGRYGEAPVIDQSDNHRQCHRPIRAHRAPALSQLLVPLQESWVKTKPLRERAMRWAVERPRAAWVWERREDGTGTNMPGPAGEGALSLPHTKRCVRVGRPCPVLRPQVDASVRASLPRAWPGHSRLWAAGSGLRGSDTLGSGHP